MNKRSDRGRSARRVAMSLTAVLCGGSIFSGCQTRLKEVILDTASSSLVTGLPNAAAGLGNFEVTYDVEAYTP